MSRLPFLVFCLLLAGGCAVGQKYDYAVSDMALPFAGSGEVAVSVLDMRSYVLSGDKGPDFVGLQRGGFGNPFDVKTDSGKPLAAVMEDVIVTALRESGFSANGLAAPSADKPAVAEALAARGAPLNAVLEVREWKTDAVWRLGLSYDLTLRIVDAQNTLLAMTETRGNKEEIGGAGFQEQNARTVRDVFETKVSRMFNDPEIKALFVGLNAN